MKKPNKTILLLVFGVLLMGINSCSKKQEQADFYKEIKSANKMVFAKMAITKTAHINESNIIGKRVAIYSYNAYLRAYIDLSALQIDDIDFNEANKTVKVTLPPVIVEDNGRDFEMRKEYENIGAARSNIDSKDRAKMKEDANKDYKKEIEENPKFKNHLIQTAEGKARKYFEKFFQGYGYTASIDFKTK